MMDYIFLVQSVHINQFLSYTKRSVYTWKNHKANKKKRRKKRRQRQTIYQQCKQWYFVSVDWVSWRCSRGPTGQGHQLQICPALHVHLGPDWKLVACVCLWQPWSQRYRLLCWCWHWKTQVVHRPSHLAFCIWTWSGKLSDYLTNLLKIHMHNNVHNLISYVFMLPKTHRTMPYLYSVLPA